jgi:integrase/recombinase XerD
MQTELQTGKVTLYIRQPQKSGKWKFIRVPERQLARLKMLDEHEGLYYLSWYEGRKKKFLNVGRSPDEARTAYTNKLNGDPITRRDALAGDSRSTVEDGLTKYFRELKNEAGKDGIGKSDRTLETYEQRLGLFHEFCDDRNIVYLDRITRDDLVAYVEWLRGQKRDLSDRSVFNIFSVARSFLIGTGVWKEALKRGHGANLGKPLKLGFTEKPVEAYTKEQLNTLFAVCDPEERLIFSFFVNSGCRKSEVANTEVADLDFKRNLLHVQGKPHRRFRLKGKEDRFVPLPASLMKLLRKHCTGKKSNDLLFPNAETGGVEKHFLRQLQTIAKRAKMPAADWTLHAFRRTFATIHHEDNGVSVNTLKTWLGHKDIETTMRYLESANASSAHVRDTVDKGALSAFV